MKKYNDKQKCVVALALVVLMGIVLFYTYEDNPTNEYTGIIRLHVIANSDTMKDQNLKLQVRDEILKTMNKNEENLTIEESREYLKAHLKNFEEVANNTIVNGGKTYTAKADIGVRWIPEKTYGEMEFPAGNYEALNVTLGEGAGQNWWCVLFPPLCLIDEDPQAMKEMGISQEENIQLKSKLTEILEEKRQTNV
ncbi:MAG: stage II sporulation protein R [Anaerovoracaceae bacterium]